MARYLDPKADLTFKKIFGQHKNLVMSLLNALLPLPEGMSIESVEYVSAENIPETPAKKYSIVDVRCTDNHGRQFLVEMQSFWNQSYFSRALYNAAAAYSSQLVRGDAFNDLHDVYALTLVNDKAFSYEGDDYIQEYYMTNRSHPDDRRTNLSLIFIELPKYKPSDKGGRAMKELWLQFLTQINEDTDVVAPELLANKDISEALELVRRSAFTSGELLAYNEYWLNISTEKSAMMESEAKGRQEGFVKGKAEGLAEGLSKGREEGAHKNSIDIARKMKANGFPMEQIIALTGLTAEEILGA